MHLQLRLLPAVFLALWPAAAAAKASAGAGDTARVESSPSENAPAQEEASQADKGRAGKDSASAAAVEEAEEEFPTTLEILLWPIEKFLVPAVNTALIPLKPPLRYFLTENVIDRTISLLSFGRDKDLMIYPTVVLSTGTRSSTGLTFRHQSPLGRPSDKLNSFYSFHVNGDWRWRFYYYLNGIGGTGLNARAALAMNRLKNASLNQPKTNRFWFYADSSNSYGLSLSHPLPFLKGTALGAAYWLKRNSYGEAPPHEDEMVSGFLVDENGVIDRGLNRDWTGHILAISLTRNTRNNPNIPVSGSDFETGWYYHFASRDYQYHRLALTWAEYFKLGRESYEPTREEEKALRELDLRQMLRNIEYRKLREQIFSRKVLAVQFHMAQSFEVEGHNAPIYALNDLGNDTPMRGYGGTRFKDLAVAAISMEYRFPMMRLVDGVIFNEYGNTGSSLATIDYLASKNSWGFGVRVRRPDIFLFRAQLGFHGLQGVQVNLSVDTAY